MGISLRQNPEVFKELSRMCIFHTHHPTSQFSAMKKKEFWKNKVRSVVRKVSFVKKREQKWRRENKQSFDVVWISMSAIIVSNICGGDLPIKQASLPLVFKEREIEKKKYLVWWCLNQIFGQAPTTAAALRLLCRRHTHTVTHTQKWKSKDSL